MECDECKIYDRNKLKKFMLGACETYVYLKMYSVVCTLISIVIEASVETAKLTCILNRAHVRWSSKEKCIMQSQLCNIAYRKIVLPNFVVAICIL